MTIVSAIINKLYISVIFYGVLQEKLEDMKEVTRSCNSEK